MLEVILYQSNQDLLNKLNSKNSLLAICPSPLIADNLRSSVPTLEVVTISKWITDHLKTLGCNRTRKSDLFLKLSGVWRHYFPDRPTSVFLDSFELFTELRSFTLNLELLAEFFKELDDDVVRSILIFWTYLDQEKIIDEHLGYKKVIESKLHRSMCFVGFKHLSGVQIDMLKELSEECDVELYFPSAVFQESLPNDWIRWLLPDLVHTQKEESPEAVLNLVVIPKGKSNVVLKKFFETSPNYDLLLASTQIGILNLQEAQKKESFFKTTENVFSIDLSHLMSLLRLKCSSEMTLSFEELSLFFEELKNQSLKAGEYRAYKLIQLLEDASSTYTEYQKKIDAFAMDILEATALLNAPRVSLISIEKDIQRTIFDMNNLSLRIGPNPLAILATGNLSSFRSNEKMLSEGMTKALRAIGPIKRAGLEFLFYKNELLSILDNKDSILLIEEQMLESDLSWREILKNFQLKTIDLGVVFSVKKLREYLLPKMKSGPFVQKSFSASKLQSFLDCPQKYYFNYIEKLDNRPLQRATLAPDELGNLEHKIIASYFQEREVTHDDIDQDFHAQLCDRIFQAYLESGQLSINETEKARSFSEIMHYSLNGIFFLLDLFKRKNGKKFLFEVPIGNNAWNIVGSIDCLMEIPDNKWILIDFKRSGTAAGSKTDTLELKKIQIWVYLLILTNQSYQFDSFGYLNLSDLSDEKLFFENSEAQKLLESLIGQAQQKIEDTIIGIQEIEEFKANPRDMKVCKYCPVELFCLKGSL